MRNWGSRWNVAFGIGLFALGTGCGSSSSSAGDTRAGAGGQSEGMSAGSAGASGNGGASASGNGGASGSAGSNAASGAGNTGGAASTAACAAYATAYCGFVLSCGPNSFNEAFGTTERCVTLYTASCLDRSTAQGATLTPTDLAACTASLVSPNCALVHTACHFSGTLVNGSACKYDAQCQSTVCVVTQWGANCGVCGAPAAEGGTCHQLNGCTSELQCSLGGDTRDTCVKTQPDGSACQPAQYDCANHNCSNNLCEPAPRTDQPCSSPCEETDDTECLAGVCKKLVWNTEGGDCDSETGVLCSGGFDCNPVGGPGKCQAAVPRPPVLAADCK